MAIECCICGKKQSGWIQEYSLDAELYDYKACFKCGEIYEKITHAEKLNMVQVEIDFIKERLHENSGNVDKNVEKHFESIFRVENGEKSYKEVQRELKEQKAVEDIEKEKRHVTYAQTFNEFYEYDVVTIINKGHGTVDKEKMMEILMDHARNGWRLHTMYSNELGKNALSVLGLGVNATACEDVLIFERRIQGTEEF